jgi:hypothetical protein
VGIVKKIIYFDLIFYSYIISGSPSPNYHNFRVGGSYKIDFLKVSSEPTAAIPDSTTPNHDTTTVTNVTF